MKHSEIRRSFLEFFKSKDHKIFPSSLLVPYNDPSLLFTSAGMVQFKPFWAGEVKPEYPRAASIQKCLRASDIDNVGRTISHETFFEMLGNFSFGDYFKKEAIEWAWEYLTDVIGLKKERLWVTVHHDDDEAYNIWLSLGLEPSKIVRLGDKTNFWGPAGGTGACGPSSEIFYDFGREFACPEGCEGPQCDCERYMEIWNLVFPQYDQKKDGTRKPLKNRGIDTGMGLERFAMVLQEKKSIFETDLFEPIKNALLGMTSLDSLSHIVYIRTAIDHVRALTFAISEGVIPSNEERGYVLRRILRRALGMLYQVGIKKPILFRLVPVVVDIMKEAYPELVEREDTVVLVVKSEEERFLKTLDRGMKIFVDYFKKGNIDEMHVFKLYDTYGFPFDLIKVLLRERGKAFNEQGFYKLLKEQRIRSKIRTDFKTNEWKIVKEVDQRFVGYENFRVETEVIRYTRDGDNGFLVLRETPFYAESGGQIGDSGIVKGNGFSFQVEDSFYIGKLRVLKGKWEGEIGNDMRVIAEVNVDRRKEIARAHTATHLLQAALRKVVGEFVRQEGSYVGVGRLRFDFTSLKPLSQMEIEKVEEMINRVVRKAWNIETIVTTLEKARQEGALAFFNEVYGDSVRMVSIGDFSKELCGGTHLSNTGEIGVFKIIKEESASAGIRRIDAYTGERAFRYLKEKIKLLEHLRQRLNITEDLIERKIDTLYSELKNMKDENYRIVSLLSEEWIKQISIIEIKKSKWVIEEVKRFPCKHLIVIGDLLKNKGLNYLLVCGKQFILFSIDSKIDLNTLRDLGFKGGGKNVIRGVFEGDFSSVKRSIINSLN